MENNKIVKYACYMINICMSVVGNLSPVLFLTFHTMYKISYSLLGLLILVNFATQLGIDLIFSFLPHKFNIQKVLRMSPLISITGLVIYASVPFFAPQFTYIGLLLGTVIFSASSGLTEVLISPVIAELPSDNPDREMSRLHSVYAWGVVFVIIFSTLFIAVFGRQNWQYLALFYTIIPFMAFILFMRSEIPHIKTPEKMTDVLKELKNGTLWLSVLAIFLGGASENTMAQWSSVYLEQTFRIDKIYGDILGVALFSVMLGLGRSLYARFGKNIEKVLFFSAIGVLLCYFVSVITTVPVIALITCAVTGLFVAMLWPGNLIVAAKRIPAGGVFVYAMMAAGGDMGGSIVPQLVGIITDAVISSERISLAARNFSMTPDQIGLKVGMLAAMFFPAAAIAVYFYILKSSKRKTA